MMKRGMGRWLRAAAALLLGAMAQGATAQSGEGLLVELPAVNVYKDSVTEDVLRWGEMTVSADISGVATVHGQYDASGDVPAGNYSGITYLGGDRYAVVSDKDSCQGWHTMEIKLDRRGRITSVRHLGFTPLPGPCRDEEGVAWCADNGHLYIACEEGPVIQEVTLSGDTVRSVLLDDFARRGVHNKLTEALCYDPSRGHLFTMNEGALRGDFARRLRLKELTRELRPVAEYSYYYDPTERPFKADGSEGDSHATGVAALATVGDGTLLVLEREFVVTAAKLGSFVLNRIYRVSPGHAGKQRVAEWRTRLSLGSLQLANYEGMCLGPRLADGQRVVVLCADSQGRYKGVLRDYFRTVTFR